MWKLRSKIEASISHHDKPSYKGMEMVKAVIFGFLATASTLTAYAEQVINVDPAYVAYAEVPGPTRAAPSFDVLLTLQTCPAKDAPPGWQRAGYMYSHGEEPACWLLTEQKIKVCPAGQYETAYTQTSYGSTTVSPCHLLPENSFYTID